MIFPVILDEGDILYPLYRADTVCKFHIGVFAEYLYRHLGVFAPHGLGFDRILDAPQRPDDVVSGLSSHIVDHRNVHPAFGLPVGEQVDHNDHDSRRDQPQCIHSGTRRDARSDRPEQIQQIQRVLDCGAEADDGQCTHHTKGDDHVGTDGQRDHAGKHAHTHQRNCKAAGVDHARIEFAVDQINEDAQRQRRQQRHGKLRRIVLGKGVQDRFFDKVFCAHGSL